MTEEYQMKRKCLAIGIILLFAGTIIVPSVPGNLLNDDTTPPITSIALNGTMGKNGWYVSKVNVTLNATDYGSGVDRTKYRINYAEWKTYVDGFIIKGDGWYEISYYSIDKAENAEDIKTASLKIDQTSPSVWLFAVGKIRWGKFLIYVEAYDHGSEMDKVEFYIDDIFKTTVIRPPYLWIYTGSTGFASVIAYDKAGNSYIPPQSPEYLNRLTGVISDVNITEATVTFKAIFVITHGAILANKQITYPNSYVGYIGKFFMNAVFYP
jgi:hypothetical protein